jgi:enamine deaminase RidA (YjgF/YER057c/UK114 family)
MEERKMADRIGTVPGMSTPSGVWSTVVTSPAKRLVFVSGLVARDAEGTLVGVGDMALQTRQVCENLKCALAAAGATLADVLRVDVYVTRIDRFAEIHAVRREYFPQDPPASTMVEVTRLVHPDAMIEITAMAAID